MRPSPTLLLAVIASGALAHPFISQDSTLTSRAIVGLDAYRLKIGSNYTKSTDVASSASISAVGQIQAATNLVRAAYPRLQFRLVDDYYQSSNGLWHVNFKQTINGLDVENADANVNVASDGKIFSYGASFFTGLIPTTDPLGLPNLIAPLQALTSIVSTLGLPISAQGATLRQISRTSYAISGVSGTNKEVKAQLVYFQTPAKLALPAWKVETDLSNPWLVSYINAVGTGEILGVVNYVADASYTVYKWPLDNPTEGARTREVDPYTDASEFTWQGTGRNNFKVTRGNNGIAQGNADGDDEYITEERPRSQTLNFDYPYDTTMTDPAKYLNASVTQLWYTVNMYHDLLYKLGFTEAAGNFETNNNGAGGKGNDGAILNAQDGSGTNNANFATPPDGEPGRMRMYIFDLTTPRRDGALEAGIVLHEYTHGLSNRLTGGPANAQCLALPEAGGMGEGWSDFFATAIRVKATDSRNTDYPVGEWAFGQPQGIREFLYSTNLRTNPNMFSSLNGKTEVHDIGEIWCVMLYEVLWNIIDKRGNTAANSPTLGAKGAPTDGRYLTMKLVLDGMTLQPCNPTFIQARDAILDADRALTGGANLCSIWSGFAKRGLGQDAIGLPLLKRNGYKIPSGIC